jgi:transposase
VLATVAALPRLEAVWLPTYAPWLNPIEKVWRWLRQDVLKLHRLASTWLGLRQRVRAFLTQFAAGSTELLRYVGLLGEGKLAQAIRGP